jgi:hypothetical protein
MRVFATACGIAAGAALYAVGVRPWLLRWGATDAEVARAMPLDGRVADPKAVSTRGISIAAPPERVWRWVVQMGERPRAGYYSYALIERVQGMEIDNSRRILPEYQELRVGEAIDRNGTMVVQLVEEPQAGGAGTLVLGPPPSVEYLQCTWAFGLYPDGRSGTRLVTRVRARFSYRALLREVPVWLWPMWLLLEPGVFVMERKMLKEIKRRAEWELRANNR